MRGPTSPSGKVGCLCQYMSNPAHNSCSRRERIICRLTFNISMAAAAAGKLPPKMHHRHSPSADSLLSLFCVYKDDSLYSQESCSVLCRPKRQCSHCPAQHPRQNVVSLKLPSSVSSVQIFMIYSSKCPCCWCQSVTKYSPSHDY